MGWDWDDVMLKQCHQLNQPWEWSVYTTYKHADDWGMVRAFMALLKTHILPQLSIYRWIFHDNHLYKTSIFIDMFIYKPSTLG